MYTNNAIDYIEFGVIDMEQAKHFYSRVFGWEFTDYSPTYVGIKGADGEMGGFTTVSVVQPGGVLPVIYSDNLEECMAAVTQAGGAVTQEPFSFPGGRRFHFSDSSGNSVAVWSDTPDHSASCEAREQAPGVTREQADGA